MPTVLVTGSNRGLGLEFVRQYAAEGWRVHACCRDPAGASALQELAAGGDVVVHALDVEDFDAIGRLAQRLAGTAIDVLLNNAGLFGPKAHAEGDPRQSFGHLDYDVWARVLRVNAQAPLRMAEAFVEHVAASGQRRIVNVSSVIGSIARTDGGNYAYRTSKAALNMVTANLARDLAPRGIRVMSVCPGWVKTEMGGAGASLDPATSIRGVRQRIAELDDARSGAFIHHDGAALPW